MTSTPSPAKPSAPQLSLIIPSYNRADLLVETLESALAQTRPFQNIIVADDGSSDRTAEVLATYAPRVQALLLPHQGVQAARNAGAAAADTEWVVFCDSDDLLEPEFVERAQRALAAEPALDIVYCNFVTFEGDRVDPHKFSMAPPGWFAGGRTVGDLIVDLPDLYMRSIRFQPLFQSGLLVRKAFFQAIGAFDTSFKGVGAEDWEFTLRAVSHGRVGLLQPVLARVRRHRGNDSLNAARMRLGEAQILAHGLVHHGVPVANRSAIEAEIRRRRFEALDEAFVQGDVPRAIEAADLLKLPKDGRIAALRHMGSRIPTRLRRRASRLLLQGHHPGNGRMTPDAKHKPPPGLRQRAVKALSRLPNYVRRFGPAHGLRLCWRLEALAPARHAPRLTLKVPGHEHPIHLRDGTADRSIFWQCLVQDQYSISQFPQAEHLRAKYRRQVDSGIKPLIIDCGGNIGLSVRWFSREFPEAHIVVVEPDSANLEMLRANVQHLGSRVTVVQGGIWSHTCHLAVTHREEGSAAFRVEEVPEGTPDSVPAFAMQDLMALAGNHQPLVVKIDVEGAQAAVFSGDTSWLGHTDLLMLELDDWQMPWRGSSRSFMQAVSAYPMDYLLSGELIVCFRDDSIDLVTDFGSGSDLG
jgi:FkbM family methyltransferase